MCSYYLEKDESWTIIVGDGNSNGRKGVECDVYVICDDK